MYKKCDNGPEGEKNMLSKIDLNEQQRDEVTLAIVAAFNQNRHYFREEMETHMKAFSQYKDKWIALDCIRGVGDEYLEHVRGMVYMLHDLGIINFDEVRSMTSETLRYAQQQKRKYEEIVMFEVSAQFEKCEKELKKNG